MDLSKKVKKRREELGWSQEELAKKMGYSSRTSINKIENGRPCSQKIIVRLAKALETTPSFLMGWQEDEIEAAAQEEKDKNAGADLDKIYSEHEKEESSGIAARVTELRQKSNRTLMEMSIDLDIPLQLLKEYESGARKIPYSIVKKMAAYFDVEDVLLYGMEFTTQKGQGELEATAKRLEQAERWANEFANVVFTPEELTELINFTKYLLSKRKQ